MEAAEYGGNVVYFQVVAPWTTRQWTVDRISGEKTWGPVAILEVYQPKGFAVNLIVCLFLVVAGPMAWRSVRLGKLRPPGMLAP